MIKQYPQRVSQTDQRITLQLNIPVTDLPPEGEQRFFQQLCKKAIDTQGWEVCREPIIQVIRSTESHLTIECLIDVLPSIRLPNSLALTVEAPPMGTPQPEEIMNRIEALQIRFGKTETVGRAAQWGDMVRIDTVGICEGELIPQSVQRGFWLSLQDKNGPLAVGLLGAQAGEQKRIPYTLPQDFPYQPWQGASASYIVYIHEIQSLQVPIASDLPMLANLPHVHDEESLFATIHEELREMHQAQWQMRLRKRVLSKLLQASKLKVPAPWVEESLVSLWQTTDLQGLKSMEKNLQLSPEEHAALFKKGLSSWQKQPHLKQSIKQNLAYQLLLWAVIREHKLQLSEPQIEKTLNTVGAPLHLSAEQVWVNLQRDQEDQRFLNQLTLDQAERYLIKQARIHSGEEVLKV